MKKNNPYVPILIREASGTEPRVFARYGELGFVSMPIDIGMELLTMPVQILAKRSRNHCLVSSISSSSGTDGWDVDICRLDG